MKTKEQIIDDLINLAFAEDIGDDDHTTLSTIPAREYGKQQLIVQEDGIPGCIDSIRGSVLTHSVKGLDISIKVVY